MSQYSSPVPTPAVPTQKTRKPRKGRAARRKRKKSLFAPWQYGVLALLGLGILIAALSLSNAGSSLSRLRAERESRETAYRAEVARHQVLYRDYIEYYAAVYELDPAYVAAIIKRESDYDPYAVSSKGAMGLMQMMPDSFSWVAPHCGVDKDDLNALYDPENAIKMGCYLLHYICPMFNGDPILIACAYHAGWGNVKGWIEKYSSDGAHLTLDQIPMEDTKSYARKVLNAYAIYQQHYY